MTGVRARASVPPREPTQLLSVDELLDSPHTRVIVCCGSGGVGKTTTAAALALRAAERGRQVAVLTIDPARRLAQSLGLRELDNTPRAVASVGQHAGGSLDAMMLDMKRTFDDVVQAHASPRKAEQILANPFYIALSSSFAGTQEYMAMEKLGQLHEQRRPDGTPRWDLIVVDTPPSRSALDFLDAPERLGSFLDGRFIRLLLAPAKASSRAYLKVVSGGMSLARSALGRVLGTQLLDDVQTLVTALDTMFGGFRERAEHTYRLLQQTGTAFLVVTAPQRDAMREASYFIDRLQADEMPLAGAIVNRMVRCADLPFLAADAQRVADELDPDVPHAFDDSRAERGGVTAADTPAGPGSCRPGSVGSGSVGPGSVADDAGERGSRFDPAEGSREAEEREGGERAGMGVNVQLRSLAAAILRLHAATAQTTVRHEDSAQRFADQHPQVPIVHVPMSALDIHDLNGLRTIGAALAGESASWHQRESPPGMR